MRARLKQSMCPLCADELTVVDGDLTCVNDCPLDPDLPWNPATQRRIDEIVKWQNTNQNNGQYDGNDCKS